MSPDALDALACEIRDEILKVCNDDGGHLASNLGVVELTMALHYVCDFAEKDSLMFDVGHQCYAHKLLTGRSLKNLRHEGGVSGFPTIAEGDDFGTGHAGTAISAALGFARANALNGSSARSIAVVGDGALTNGECYEALNDAGNSDIPLLVIINDNEMSIAKNVGAMAKYLSRNSRRKFYNIFKSGIKKLLGRGRIYRAAYVLERAFRQIWVESGLFDSLGYKYVGPVDGHNVEDLIDSIRYCLDQNRLMVLHVITEKGRGYAPAQKDPANFHSVDAAAAKSAQGEICSDVVGRVLCRLGGSDSRVCAVTAAMPVSTGVADFAAKHPARAFDVGIAESHAVTMAAAMAAKGMRPFVAIYSSFMQRSYDQIIHDVALQNLPVTLLMDRAGFSASDGGTHHGLFDIAFLQSVPNMTILAPRDLCQLERMMEYSLSLNSPCAIRYPKSLPALIEGKGEVPMNRWEKLVDGDDAAIIACGSMVSPALEAAAELQKGGISAMVIDGRCIKPLDEELLISLARLPIVTVEEGMRRGGFGEAVLSRCPGNVRMEVLAVGDRFVGHGSFNRMLEDEGLTAGAIADSVRGLFTRS